MKFTVMTLFPEMVMSGLNTSIIGRAVTNGLLDISAVNIRDYSEDKHRHTDDYPYGGGAGMVMSAEPIYKCYLDILESSPMYKASGRKPKVIYMTPVGHTFNQKTAKRLAGEEELIFLCGHYEGVDERVIEEIVDESLSVGDFVLSGGELPSMIMIDAISRMVPGVLTNEESGVSESFEDGLLEYPQYTRPEVWRDKPVPEILLSGHHANIAKWRHEMSLERTRQFRPDLYEKYGESK